MRAVRSNRLNGLALSDGWSITLEIASITAIFLVIGLLLNFRGPDPSASLPTGLNQVPPPCGTSPYAPPCRFESEIKGTVSVDGKPAAGFGVALASQGKSATTGAGGGYSFKGLGAGNYAVVLSYDKTKYKNPDPDTKFVGIGDSEIATVNFNLQSLATPSPLSATPTPKSFSPSLLVEPFSANNGSEVTLTGSGYNPFGPDGGPNQVTVTLEPTTSGSVRGLSVASAIANLGTFTVDSTGAFKNKVTVPVALSPQTVLVLGTDKNGQSASKNFSVTRADVSCRPASAVADKLRLTSAALEISPGVFRICVSVTAPSNDGVNLNDTVIVNLPSGTTATQVSVSTGTVSVSGSTVRWGGFSLASQQNANLLLTVGSTTLNGTSVFVSGRFNRGLAFQQRFGGLPDLVEISAAAGGGNTGGTSNVVVPVGAPSTGTGSNQNDDSTGLIALLVGAWAATVGLLVGWRVISRRRRT